MMLINIRDKAKSSDNVNVVYLRAIQQISKNKIHKLLMKPASMIGL